MLSSTYYSILTSAGHVFAERKIARDGEDRVSQAGQVADETQDMQRCLLQLSEAGEGLCVCHD